MSSSFLHRDICPPPNNNKKNVDSSAKSGPVVDSCQNACTFPQPHTREQTPAPAPPQQPLHDVHRKLSFQSPPPSTHNPSGCRTGSILKVGSHSPTGLCLRTFRSLPKGWSARGRGTHTGAEPKPRTQPSSNLGMGAGVG